MNVFRILADSAHILAIMVLLYKFLSTKSAAGVSGRTQILYGIVFSTRYIDLFFYFISIYNTALKITFIAVTCFFIYLIYFRFKKTYDHENDTFSIWLLLIPSVVFGFYYVDFNFYEGLWSTSILLEAVAIIPQMYLIYKTGNVEKYIVPYLLLLGSYRLLYIFNWIFRYYNEGYYISISYRSGLIQSLIYCIFLCYYFLYMKGKTGTHNKYAENLPQVITNDRLIKESQSSDIPSVFITGCKQEKHVDSEECKNGNQLFAKMLEEHI